MENSQAWEISVVQKRRAHRDCGGPVGSKRKVPRNGHGLESKLETKLHEARIVDGGGDGAEARGGEIRDAEATGAVWRSELRMVEEVEELGTEVQTHVLPWELELLDDGEVCVYKIRSCDWCARGITKLAVRRLSKAGGIKPLVDGMGTGIGIAAGDQIRTCQAVRVVVEEADT